MHNKIRTHEDYTTAHESKSAINLLKIVEEVCEHGDLTKNKRVQQFFAIKRVHNLRQGEDMNIGEYQNKFETMLKIAERLGGTFYEGDNVKAAKGSIITNKGDTTKEVEKRIIATV